MTTWNITDADRDAQGRIRTLAELLPAPPAPDRPTWRPGRLELAGAVAGLVLTVALIALMSRFAPAPAPHVAPTAQPTARPTVRPPTPAPAAAATAVPTAQPPTPAPVVVYEPPPCDPADPPFQVREQVGDIGSVVGLSCDSLAAAQAIADERAAQMRAEAWHPPMPAEACAGWHPPLTLPKDCKPLDQN